MGDVVEFPQGESGDYRYTVGPAKCGECGHEWEAVGKVPVNYTFVCPSCGDPEARYNAQFGFSDDELVFQCGQCEGTHFEVGPESCMCVTCGDEKPWGHVFE